MENDSVSLSNICSGKAEVLFQAELKRIVDNIRDKRTKTSDKRKIIIEFVISPDVNREVGDVCVSSKCKLAGFDRVTGEIFITEEDGEFSAKNEDTRQLTFESAGMFEKGPA